MTVDMAATIGNETFYDRDGNLASWPGGRTRFRKSTYEDVAAHGLYPYILEEYDPSIHKKVGDKIFNGVFWTHTLEAKTQEEIERAQCDAAIQKIDEELSLIDNSCPRSVEDLVEQLITLNKIQATDVPMYLKSNIERKKSLRETRAYLVDGIITEAEAAEVEQTKSTFWQWLTTYTGLW